LPRITTALRREAIDIATDREHGYDRTLMSDDRSRMIAALQAHVVPELRRRGFKGSFPHFRRAAAQRIDLLTFQFDKWGAGRGVARQKTTLPNLR
jgi:hypothetical protein